MFRNFRLLSRFSWVPRPPVQQFTSSARLHTLSTNISRLNLNRLSAVAIPPYSPQMFLFPIQTRNYAIPRKKRTIDVQEQPTPTTTYERPLTRPRGEESQPTSAYPENEVYQREEQARMRQIDTLTEETKAHMRKVYSTVGTTIGLAGIGGFLAMFPPLSAMHPIIPALLSFVPLLGIMFTQHTPENRTKRSLMLGSFGFLSGLSIGPLLKIAMLVNPMIIATSAALTAGLFGAMTALSLFMPSKSALSWGAPLGGGLLVLIGCGIASFFVPATSVFYPILHSVLTYGGLAVFTLYIAFDTQQIIHDFENGNDDHISHAINLFIDIFAIFRRILYMFLNRED